MPIAEQAVVAHAMEAGRQHVQEKPPDTLRRVECHRPLGVCRVGVVVRVAEPHVVVVDVDQPLVGNRDAVGVATDVVEDLLRAGEARTTACGA